MIKKFLVSVLFSLMVAPIQATVNTIVTFPGGSKNGSVQFNKSGQFSGDTQLIYSTRTFTLNVPGIAISTVTIKGITYYFPTSQTGGGFLKTDGAGGLTWEEPTTTVSGVAAPIGVFDGAVLISSPTANFAFNGTDFAVTLAGGATAQIALSALVTKLGSDIDLTSEVTGVLPAANLPTTVVYTNTDQTISGKKTVSSSFTVTGGMLVASGITTDSMTVTGISASRPVKTSPTNQLTTGQINLADANEVSGVLSSVNLSTSVVYTDTNQTISGVKTITSSLTVVTSGGTGSSGATFTNTTNSGGGPSTAVVIISTKTGSRQADGLAVYSYGVGGTVGISATSSNLGTGSSDGYAMRATVTASSASGNVNTAGWFSASGAATNYGINVASGSIKQTLTNTILAADSNGVIISTTVSGGGSGTSPLSGFYLKDSSNVKWLVVANSTGTLTTSVASSVPAGTLYRNSIVIQDASFGLWTLTINTSGVLTTASGGSTSSVIQDILVNDSTGLTWILTINTSGALVTS